MRERTNDPDETEGRRLYRLAADTLARAQIAYANRKVAYRLEAPLTEGGGKSLDAVQSRVQSPR